FFRVGEGAEEPDTQVHVAPLQIVDEGMADPEAHGVWVSPCLLTPSSRGSVRLASKDPSAKPIIRNEFFSAEGDIERMVAAVRLAEEICAQQAMRPYCAEVFTGPGGESDEDVRAHVAATTFPIYHPVGTCALGSVLDAELRVEGLEGLRVVDASVMPVVPRGNTNAPTIAVAERAADLIRGLTPLRGEPERDLAH
ncbi:MAG TPA: GMC oxidoreductase, partial [Solirubrobacterales bacterium]|nr:GMC oxidoreductase [Solirubrobacterales bacterium]